MNQARLFQGTALTGSDQSGHLFYVHPGAYCMPLLPVRQSGLCGEIDTTEKQLLELHRSWSATFTCVEEMQRLQLIFW